MTFQEHIQSQHRKLEQERIDAPYREYKEYLKATLEWLEAQMPKEKDITLNEVGTVGDYHTHGFNEYHDAVRSLFSTIKKELEGDCG